MSDWVDGPYPIELKAGQSAMLCTCKQSKRAPYCDGSHSGTGKSPTFYDAEKDETVVICGCCKSCIKPKCDGSHSR